MIMAGAHSASLPRLSKNPSRWFGGPQPSKCNPNPATCAADSEALRSKVSLHCFPPGRLIEPRGKQCKYSEKDAAGGLFRHAAGQNRVTVCPILFYLSTGIRLINTNFCKSLLSVCYPFHGHKWLDKSAVLSDR